MDTATSLWVSRHLGAVDIVQVYGHRPVASEVWWLSPYEFVAEWAVTLARVPTTQREWNHEDKASWDVTLTPAGIQKMQRETDPDKKIQLQPERRLPAKSVMDTQSHWPTRDHRNEPVAASLLSPTASSPMLPAL